MMLGVQSELEHEEQIPDKISIPRDATCTPIGRGRYKTTTRDGQTTVLQPMWGKENLTEPLDVFQVLFAK